MSKPKDPFVFVNHIYDAIQDIKNYRDSVSSLESFFDDEKTQDAVIRKLEIIGEATNNLSSEFQSFHPEVNWRGPVGLRNILVHQYFEVDLEAIWEVVNRDLLEFEKDIEILLSSKK